MSKRKVLCIPLACATAVLVAALSAGERPDTFGSLVAVPACGAAAALLDRCENIFRLMFSGVS